MDLFDTSTSSPYTLYNLPGIPSNVLRHLTRQKIVAPPFCGQFSLGPIVVSDSDWDDGNEVLVSQKQTHSFTGKAVVITKCRIIMTTMIVHQMRKTSR